MPTTDLIVQVSLNLGIPLDESKKMLETVPYEIKGDDLILHFPQKVTFWSVDIKAKREENNDKTQQSPANCSRTTTSKKTKG